MANIVIYYSQNQGESVDKSVDNIKNLIQCLEIHHIIKGVYLDGFNERNELNELLNSSLAGIDYLYLNKPLPDEFDNLLINQLSKTEQFKVTYFDVT